MASEHFYKPAFSFGHEQTTHYSCASRRNRHPIVYFSPLLPFKAFRIFLTLFITVILLLVPSPCLGGSYDDKRSLHDTLLAKTKYNPDVRPLVDQSDVLYVFVEFELVSIVEVNDVVQRFLCNGFLFLSWVDEIIQWDPSTLNGEWVIAPKPQDVFRPRMVLMNTLGDRDLFEDDYAPMNLHYDGWASWIPGSIFPASCKLDLTNYPFDKQNCEIRMVVMSYSEAELQFVSANNDVSFSFYTENGEWDIESSNVTTPPIKVQGNNITSISVSFQLKRKPLFLVISIILPIVFLSLLNMLVFVIPVDSGEKISYGITVLLALTVFMSIMSAMLPRSSESMPLMISYILCLLILSVLTVVDSIIIVRIHHMEEKERRSLKAQRNFKSTLPKITMLRRAVSPLENSLRIPDKRGLGSRHQDATIVDEEQVNYTERPNGVLAGTAWSSTNEIKVNKYKLIGKHIDLISLIVFGLVWVTVTIAFFVRIAT